MTYGDPSDEHRSAVKQIADARDRALNHVSALRTGRDDAEHQNLCRIDGRRGTPLSIEATQAVVDYLLQLRPYRRNSEKWEIDFGVVQLPESFREQSPGLNRGYRLFYAAQQPYVRLRGLSEILNQLNRTLIYTTDVPPSSSASTSTPKHTVRLEDASYALSSSSFDRFLDGELAHEEIREIGRPVEQDNGESEYRPPRLSENADTRQYKFVLPQDDLLQLVEIADEVAAEMDLLVDIEPPDHTAGGAGAV